jgi:hypothetical protein
VQPIASPEMYRNIRLWMEPIFPAIDEVLVGRLRNAAPKYGLELLSPAQKALRNGNRLQEVDESLSFCLTGQLRTRYGK